MERNINIDVPRLLKDYETLQENASKVYRTVTAGMITVINQPDYTCSADTVIKMYEAAKDKFVSENYINKEETRRDMLELVGDNIELKQRIFEYFK